MYVHFRSGGEWLITNMRRGESLFEMDSDNYVSYSNAPVYSFKCSNKLIGFTSERHHRGR